MKKRVATLYDLAKALGISTGTVHRALHNHPEVNVQTKSRVLQMAKSMQYRPNLAARNLVKRHRLRISVNTLKGTASFWEQVRSGIRFEAESHNTGGTELEFRTFPKIGEGELEAFEAALESKVDGIITFPSLPKELGTLMTRATQAKVPVVCVTTDAPGTGRLAVVSIDTSVSGSLAGDLLGQLLRGKGKVAVTVAELTINEHAEKFRGFTETIQKYHPGITVVDCIEEHAIEAETYAKCRELFETQPDLDGIYVAREASMPLLKAARDTGILPRLTIITTDLAPDLVEHIRAGHVACTIDQRPHAQGRLAFRVLHKYLIEGSCPNSQVLLSPRLVMRGNLDFVLQRQSLSETHEMRQDEFIDSAALEGFTLG